MSGTAQEVRPRENESGKKAAATEKQVFGGPANEPVRPSDTSSLLDKQLPVKAPQAAEPSKSEGLRNYEKTLGTWLGPKLYKAVSKELTQDKLAKVANGAMKSGLKSLGSAVGNLDEGADPAHVDKLVQALQAEFGTAAGDWVKSNGDGLTDALNGWVDANPTIIVTLALLAAAGAVAADMDIPEFSKKMGLGGGFSAEVGVEIGSLRNIALEKIEAKIAYQSKKLTATWVGAFEDDKLSSKLDLKYKFSENLSGSAYGKYDEQDGMSGGVNLDYKKNDRFSFGAYGKHSEKNGSEVGVGIKWKF